MTTEGTFLLQAGIFLDNVAGINRRKSRGLANTNLSKLPSKINPSLNFSGFFFFCRAEQGSWEGEWVLCCHTQEVTEPFKCWSDLIFQKCVQIARVRQSPSIAALSPKAEILQSNACIPEVITSNTLSQKAKPNSPGNAFGIKVK